MRQDVVGLARCVFIHPAATAVYVRGVVEFHRVVVNAGMKLCERNLLDESTGYDGDDFSLRSIIHSGQ